MSESTKWRIAHLSDPNTEVVFVAKFNEAYKANDKPADMAMFSHNDSFGTLMAVSITPESVQYCPFSLNWYEQHKAPFDFGNVGWVAGDERRKNG
jgi:hypothetical protein